MKALVDASSGFWGAGESRAAQFGLITGFDTTTGQPRIPAEGVGHFEPRSFRFHLLNRGSEAGATDRRWSVQTVNDRLTWSRPSDTQEESPFQLDYWSSANRSTREVDLEGRATIPATMRRIVDDHDNRYSLAQTIGDIPGLRLRPGQLGYAFGPNPRGFSSIAGVDSTGTFNLPFQRGIYDPAAVSQQLRTVAARGGDVLTRGAVGRNVFDAAPLQVGTVSREENPPLGSVRNLDSSRYVSHESGLGGYVWSPADGGRVGLLQSVYAPELAAGSYSIGRDGTPIGPLPLRCDVQFGFPPAGSTVPLVGRLDFQPVDATEREIRGAPFTGIFGFRPETSGGVNGTGVWGPVVYVDAQLPPGDEPQPTGTGPVGGGGRGGGGGGGGNPPPFAPPGGGGAGGGNPPPGGGGGSGGDGGDEGEDNTDDQGADFDADGNLRGPQRDPKPPKPPKPHVHTGQWHGPYLGPTPQAPGAPGDLFTPVSATGIRSGPTGGGYGFPVVDSAIGTLGLGTGVGQGFYPGIGTQPPAAGETGPGPSSGRVHVPLLESDNVEEALRAKWGGGVVLDCQDPPFTSGCGPSIGVEAVPPFQETIGALNSGTVAVHGWPGVGATGQDLHVHTQSGSISLANNAPAFGGGRHNLLSAPAAFFGSSEGGFQTLQDHVRYQDLVSEAQKRLLYGAFGGESSYAGQISVMSQNTPSQPPGRNMIGNFFTGGVGQELNVNGSSALDVRSVIEAGAGAAVFAGYGSVGAIIREHRGQGHITDRRPLLYLDNDRGNRGNVPADMISTPDRGFVVTGAGAGIMAGAYALGSKPDDIAFAAGYRAPLGGLAGSPTWTVNADGTMLLGEQGETPDAPSEGVLVYNDGDGLKTIDSAGVTGTLGGGGGNTGSAFVSPAGPGWNAPTSFTEVLNEPASGTTMETVGQVPAGSMLIGVYGTILSEFDTPSGATDYWGLDNAALPFSSPPRFGRTDSGDHGVGSKVGPKDMLVDPVQWVTTDTGIRFSAFNWSFNSGSGQVEITVIYQTPIDY